MKKIALMLVVGALALSCKKEVAKVETSNQIRRSSIQLSNQESKLYFAIALSKAVQKEKALRGKLKKSTKSATTSL